MPTTRPRYQITETDRLAEALDAAAAHWPHDAQNRAKLLLHLVEEGFAVLVNEREELLRARREAIRTTSGTFADLFPPDYLADLREDWPA
ncbi:MAG: hypothetical protein ACT4QG_05460 [Sporichthyaceae bacterium]